MDPSARAPASAGELVVAFFAGGLEPLLEALVVGPLLALAALWEAVLSAGAGFAGPASALMTLVVVLGLDRRRPGGKMARSTGDGGPTANRGR